GRARGAGVVARRARPGALAFEALAHAPGLGAQARGFAGARGLVDCLARAPLHVAAELQVARHGAQLHVGEPLPNVRALAQVVNESVRRRSEGAVSAVGPQAQVYAVEMAVAREV